ncbi:MAG: Stp1/IreP family PP2C-type Ser/Thr phosphatase [Caloramator sp.]|nr:Stp1/IreP family PP2C-type Ser/Thr phosphatase [Caloramator sp.]
MYIKCKTDIGKARELNEDYVIMLKSNNYALIAVADGMGGHNAGEVASKIASLSLRDFVFNNYNKYYDKSELIRDAMLEANLRVYEKSKDANQLSGMGTTLTCCLMVLDKAFIGHVGDSRAYLINKEGIKKLTEDHSFVQQLVKNGTITELEAENHPKKNLITRAIGLEKNVVIDIIEVDFKKDDLILLCTDGLTTYLTKEEIFEIVNDKKEDAVETLIEIANDRGGSDNISVVIARKEDGR